MKVICPKCQFENQADSSRVVCARCATIIEVRMDQGTGFDSNGKRQTARLPFASNSSSGANQSLGNQSFSQNQDVYATRIGDDFDDVLDVPVQSQSNYQATEDPPPVYEDVFSSQGQDQTSLYDFTPYEKNSNPIEYRAGGTRQRETQDYTEPAEQEFMGWPVLPEGSGDEEEVAGTSRGGLILRVGVIVVVFGALCFLAYYFLQDFIRIKIGGGEGSVATVKAPNGNQPPNSGASGQPNNATTEQPPATAPKPVESAPPQDSKPQDAKTKEGQVVQIPPVQKSAGVTGPVGASDPPKPTPPPVTIPKVQSKGNVTIQVGSFKDQGEADARASRLNSATGGDFRVVKGDVPGKGIWYRVQHVSGFPTRDAATSYGNQLRAKNLITEFFVTTK
ncbi:MAG TPA: SPOR domain-containing protein [Blastocatellia bacterium]|nr:SPOR domain-containing protein [Blastocatellia bacterium]